MNRVSLTNQFVRIFSHSLRCEWRTPDRLVTPLLFAVTVLLLCKFSFGEVDQQYETQIFVAQTILAAFLAVQSSLVRAFSADEDDQAFTLMRTYPVQAEVWFSAKFLASLLNSILVLVLFFGISSILSSRELSFDLAGKIFLVLILMMIGLSAIGLLLSAIMMRSDARQLLFPLLYFPLSVPAILAAAQSFQVLFGDNPADFGQLIYSWMGLLVIFDVIFLTIAVLLFGELIKAD